MTPATRSYQCGPGPVARALTEFQNRGGVIHGPESGGTLRVDSPIGPVEGHFTFDGETLTVTLTQAPAVLALEMIWSRLARICGEPVGRA